MCWVIGVELDAQDSQQKQRLVYVNTAHYNHLEHGYAATVYKAQGITVDRTYLLTSYHYDAHSTYVALTRHRQSCDVFVSREAFANDRQLNETLKRNRAKDVTLDYTNMNAEFARQRAIHANKESTTDKDRHTIEQFTRHYLHDKDALGFQEQLDSFSREFKQSSAYAKLAKEARVKEISTEIAQRCTAILNKQDQQVVSREHTPQQNTKMRGIEREDREIER